MEVILLFSKMQTNEIADPLIVMLEETDIRGLVRLLGAVSILKVDLDQKKQFLLAGMCQLIDGDGWAWSLRKLSKDSASADCLNAISGGDMKALPSSPLLSPVPETLLFHGKKPLDREAKDSVETQDGIQGCLSAPATEYAATGALHGGLVISVTQIANDQVSLLRFGRHAGREPFSPREEMMARIFCEEIPWLHEDNVMRARAHAKLKLPPQQLATLTLLIEGLSKKAIAKRLQLSPNTVHGYIKEIYRYFGRTLTQNS